MKKRTNLFWFEVGRAISFAVMTAGFLYGINGISEWKGIFMVILGIVCFWATGEAFSRKA